MANTKALLDTRSWYASPDRKFNPVPWFLPVTQLAFMGSTLLPRDKRIRYAAPALLLLVSQTRNVSTGDPRDYLRASQVLSLAMKFVDFGLLVKDNEEFKVKSGVEQREENVKKGIFQRVRDSVELWLFTMRGVGWNWEVGGIPERAPQSTRSVLCFLDIDHD